MPLLRLRLPIYSSTVARRCLAIAALDSVDVVLVDLQDVGARYYSYPTTTVLVMQDAVRRGSLFGARPAEPDRRCRVPRDIPPRPWSASSTSSRARCGTHDDRRAARVRQRRAGIHAVTVSRRWVGAARCFTTTRDYPGCDRAQLAGSGERASTTRDVSVRGTNLRSAAACVRVPGGRPRRGSTPGLLPASGWGTMGTGG